MIRDNFAYFFIKTYVVGAEHPQQLSTYNIGFYEDLTKIIFQLSSNVIKYAPYLYFCMCIAYGAILLICLILYKARFLSYSFEGVACTIIYTPMQYTAFFFHGCKNQRTNGPVNAHLISWPSKVQNIHNLENIW